MNLYNQLQEIRRKALSELKDKTLITEEEIDKRGDEVELEDLFYELPQTPVYLKHGMVAHTYIVGYKDGMFQCYDDETGEMFETEPVFTGTDALVEFLNFER